MGTKMATYSSIHCVYVCGMCLLVKYMRFYQNGCTLYSKQESTNVKEMVYHQGRIAGGVYVVKTLS